MAVQETYSSARSGWTWSRAGLSRLINWLVLLAALICTVSLERYLASLSLREVYIGYDLFDDTWQHVERSLGAVHAAEYIVAALLIYVTAVSLINVGRQAIWHTPTRWPDHFISIAIVFVAVVLIWSAWNITVYFFLAFGRDLLALPIAALYALIPTLLAGVLYARAGLHDQPDS